MQNIPQITYSLFDAYKTQTINVCGFIFRINSKRNHLIESKYEIYYESEKKE